MTLALVHGAFHGSWQWGPLLAELDRIGVPAVTVDLPVGDPVKSAVDYATVCAEAFRGHDDLVVVGHSMAGWVLPFLAEVLPVRRLVFLAAALQCEHFGLDMSTMLTLPPDAQRLDADGLVRLSPDVAASCFYQDVSDGLRHWALSSLRPQSASVYPSRQPSLDSLPESVFVVGQEDRVVSPEWSRVAALAVSGRPAVELSGGHSPFLARPRELADLLRDLAG